MADIFKGADDRAQTVYRDAKRSVLSAFFDGFLFALKDNIPDIDLNQKLSDDYSDMKIKYVENRMELSKQKHDNRELRKENLELKAKINELRDEINSKIERKAFFQ